jgi:hypothetical protein
MDTNQGVQRNCAAYHIMFCSPRRHSKCPKSSISQSSACLMPHRSVTGLPLSATFTAARNRGLSPVRRIPVSNPSVIQLGTLALSTNAGAKTHLSPSRGAPCQGIDCSFAINRTAERERNYDDDELSHLTAATPVNERHLRRVRLRSMI